MIVDVLLVRIVKVFGVAVRTINYRVAQADHHRAPVAFAHASVLRIRDSFSECFGEQVTQEARIDTPKC